MAEDTRPEIPVRRDVAKAYSRRGFLHVLAAGCAAGGLTGMLAACATSTSVSRPSPAVTPTPSAPLLPSAAITPANAATVALLGTLRPMAGSVRGVAWAPDGRRLALGGYQSVQVWDAVAGKRLAVLAGHTAQVYGMAWSPTGETFASASNDGTVRLWDAQSASMLHALTDPASTPFFSVAWSPDGGRICAGAEDGSVSIWDARKGARVATWSGPAEGPSLGGRFPYAAWGISWSPDGKRIVSTRYDGLILVWDVASGTSRAIPKTDSQPNTVAWAPDGTRFALTDDAGNVILWDGANLTRGKDLSEPANASAGWSYGLAWSPTGDMVAASRETGIVQVWDASAGQQLAALRGHTSQVWGLAWSPDGLRLASASDDNTVRLWGVA